VPANSGHQADRLKRAGALETGIRKYGSWIEQGRGVSEHEGQRTPPHPSPTYVCIYCMADKRAGSTASPAPLEGRCSPLLRGLSKAPAHIGPPLWWSLLLGHPGLLQGTCEKSRLGARSGSPSSLLLSDLCLPSCEKRGTGPGRPGSPPGDGQ
jgi:hypothetical protein